MNPFPHERGSGWSFQRSTWVLPLIIGIGIGALLFGFNGLGWGQRGGQRERFAPIAQGHGHRHADAPQAPNDAAQSAPQAPNHVDPRADRSAPGFAGAQRDGRRDHGFGFLPFAPFRLLLPLLLIGAGAWLIAGQRGGGPTPPSTPSAQPNPPYVIATAPANQESPPTTDQPATGETRQL